MEPLDFLLEQQYRVAPTAVTTSMMTMALITGIPMFLNMLSLSLPSPPCLPFSFSCKADEEQWHLGVLLVLINVLFSVHYSRRYN